MSERTQQQIVAEIAEHAIAIAALNEELARGSKRPTAKRRKLTPPTEQPSPTILREVAGKLRRMR